MTRNVPVRFSRMVNSQTVDKTGTAGKNPAMTTSPALAASSMCGLVLAGGLGRRMGGSDKGLLTLDGEQLAARVLDRLRPQVGSIVINANRNLHIWQGFGVPVVSDVIGGFSGPLAGMHAGLGVCTESWLLTVPCDSPFLPADLAQQLGAKVLSANADLAVARSAGGLQPVFVLMRSSLHASLESYLVSGGRKIVDWLSTVRHVVVDFPDPDAFANINTPDDLAGARLSGRC